MSSKNRGAKPLKYDFYPTPIEVLDAIYNEIDFSKVKKYRSPCLGDGHLYEKIKKLDTIEEVEWYEIRKGKDYLVDDDRQTVDLEIANPPFTVALDFFKKSIEHSKCSIMLQRLNFLESKARQNFWKENTPTHLFILSARPKFIKRCKKCNLSFHPKETECSECKGKIALASDSTGYCWYVFNGEETMKKPSGIYFI